MDIPKELGTHKKSRTFVFLYYANLNSEAKGEINL